MSTTKRRIRKKERSSLVASLSSHISATNLNFIHHSSTLWTCLTSEPFPMLETRDMRKNRKRNKKQNQRITFEVRHYFEDICGLVSEDEEAIGLVVGLLDGRHSGQTTMQCVCWNDTSLHTISAASVRCPQQPLTTVIAAFPLLLGSERPLHALGGWHFYGLYEGSCQTILISGFRGCSYQFSYLLFVSLGNSFFYFVC